VRSVSIDPDEVRSLPLLDGVSPERIEWIAARLEERHAEPGEHLMSETAPGYTFFLILDGTVRVIRDRETIATLGPGEFFGEAAIVGPSGRRNASVVAESPVRVGAMFGTEFRVMERELPEVADRIREVTAARAPAE